jgi:hypothetical protein
MLVVLEKTNSGAHGLFIAGHPYELTKTQLDAIADEAALQRKEFNYRVVKNSEEVNRASKKKRQTTPANKQLHGETETK